MTRILLLATLALTLLALAACGGDAGPEELEEDEAAADTPTTGETATGDGPPSITFDLEERNDSGQYGRATLTDMGEGQTRVVLELFEGPDNVQPAHIHSGTCDDVGEIVIPLEAPRTDGRTPVSTGRWTS